MLWRRDCPREESVDDLGEYSPSFSVDPGLFPGELLAI